MNRIVLLAIVPLSLLIPELSFTLEVTPEESALLAGFNGLWEEVDKIVKPIEKQSVDEVVFSSYFYPTVIYFGGLGWCILQILLSFIQLLRLRQNGFLYRTGTIKIYLANVTDSFSSFNSIFIPKKDLAHFKGAVLAHEMAHVKQKHTYDLVLVAFFISVCWFNPLVYLYRKVLKSLHEYQADEIAIRSVFSKSDYLEVLLQQFDRKHSPQLTSFFNYSTIKSRIEMITKENSTKQQLVRYAALLPLLVGLPLAFTTPVEEVQAMLIPQQFMIQMDLVVDPPSIYPLKNRNEGRVSSSFGKRVHPIFKKERMHFGVDIEAPTGTEVVATADGTVTLAKEGKNYGKYVVIKHSDSYETKYAHLDSYAVSVNQEVKKGEVIGTIGSTGKSYGSHLHYEVKKDGKFRDPELFFE